MKLGGVIVGSKAFLLLSGPVAAGKSTVTKALVNEHGFRSIRSGKYLSGLAQQQGLSTSRRALQILGDELDDKTDGTWLIDDVATSLIQGNCGQRRWLLDSVRKARQVEHFRTRFGSEVLHVHLVAPEEELRRRYEERVRQGGEYEGGTSYRQAISHPNELAARALGGIADMTLDTTDGRVVDQILARMFG